MRNLYFSDGHKSEQLLYEDLIIEAVKIYGQDLYYMPRDLVNIDSVFKEDPVSSFNSSYRVEMYVESNDGFDGEGDLFSKFGVEIRDSVTLIMAKRRWNETVRKYDNEIQTDRPSEGDLIYTPFAKKLFQIMHVEHEQPFYQLNNLPVYKLRCELFEYNDEDIDTGNPDIDRIEAANAFSFDLTLDSDSLGFIVGETVNQTISDGVIMSGEVSSWNPDTNILKVIHAGADDGNFHTFITSTQIQGSTNNTPGSGVPVLSGANVISITESNNVISNEQNLDFATEIEDFLDFSEGNPFGEVVKSTGFTS